MKTFLLIGLLSVSTLSFAKSEVKDFNKVLLENVKAEINNEHNNQFQKKAVGRGPASVSPMEPEFHQNEKIEKNVRQFGSKKW